MSTLRAGLVGLGAMGRNHARVLDSLGDVEVVGVAEPGTPASRPPSSATVVADVHELIALGLDYAVVACPTAMHEEVGVALAEAGVCALIEKPLAKDVGSARRIAEAFGAAGLVAGVGHVERFNPALLGLRDRLAAGELGEVYQVATRRQGPFPVRIADVGVALDLATHDIDLTAWATGSPYATVSARTSRRSGRPHEDLVAVVGSLEDGTTVNHLINWLSPLKERQTVVTGELGCYIADTLTADLTYYSNGAALTEWDAISNFRGVSEGDVVRYALTKREPLLVEHERFRDAVRSGDPAGIVTLADGLRTVDVAEAVLRSSETGTVVTVEHASVDPVGVEHRG